MGQRNSGGQLSVCCGQTELKAQKLWPNETKNTKTATAKQGAAGPNPRWMRKKEKRKRVWMELTLKRTSETSAPTTASHTRTHVAAQATAGSRRPWQPHYPSVKLER